MGKVRGRFVEGLRKVRGSGHREGGRRCAPLSGGERGKPDETVAWLIGEGSSRRRRSPSATAAFASRRQTPNCGVLQPIWHRDEKKPSVTFVKSMAFATFVVSLPLSCSGVTSHGSCPFRPWQQRVR
eukprot:2580243-Pleurochrysis_carterae.AAC.4